MAHFKCRKQTYEARQAHSLRRELHESQTTTPGPGTRVQSQTTLGSHATSLSTSRRPFLHHVHPRCVPSTPEDFIPTPIGATNNRCGCARTTIVTYKHAVIRSRIGKCTCVRMPAPSRDETNLKRGELRTMVSRLTGPTEA